jgi:signal peptidase II
MRNIIYSLACFVLITCDQWSKYAITEILFRKSGQGFWDWLLHAPERLEFFKIEVTPFLNMVMVWNWGISFGLFSQQSPLTPIILSIVSLMVAGIFVWWLIKATDKLQIIGAILIISGALGNIIDRLRFQAVIDFIDVHAFGYHWPAFNAADSFISIGVMCLIVHMMFFEKTLQKAEKDTVE